ncbi:hypothetical protein ILUMI_11110 [Ignelater luminosus]|uniref:Uncharacterized protein n=1 Tax=Ignelater luminosus TaxID=2038154 RepID=A0A8K0G818_IGNLU|nr:hypothetical protein ILUMI_11110 [Ignelater luminosus]
MKDQENSKDIIPVSEDKTARQGQPRFTLSAEKYLVSPSTSQMRMELSATALTIDRFGLSDRATAAVASIRREKNRARKTLQFTEGLSPLRGLHFDGRKDNTVALEQNGAKFYRHEVVEKHISLIKEQGQFLEYVAPASGTGFNIANSIFQNISESHYDLNTLVTIGCDATVTNTGLINGVIRHIELILKIPLQWFVCILHFNELPLRHLFAQFDETKSGPKSFNGAIRKQLTGCEKLVVSKI